MAAGIGFSRIYLGVHYSSDVAGGVLLGLAWLIAGITVAEIDRPLAQQEMRPQVS